MNKQTTPPLILLFIFLMTLGKIHAQASTGADRMDFIQAEIVRIDRLDGKEDGKIETRDSVKNIIAHRAYFEWPDSIDTYIRVSNFKEADRKIYRDYLFRCLRRVDNTTYKRVSYYDELFHHLYKEVIALHDNRLPGVLKQNIKLSIQTCGVFRYERVAESFLCYASHWEPDEVFKYVDDYAERPYAQHVIDHTAIYAPEVAKKYMLIN